LLACATPWFKSSPLGGKESAKLQSYSKNGLKIGL
jgi:hypothetical protein